MRQFLAESTLLSLFSAVLGIALGILALKPVLALIPAHYIGEETDVHVSAVACLVSVLVALILGIVFGLTPAILISGRKITENLGQTEPHWPRTEAVALAVCWCLLRSRLLLWYSPRRA